jgi:hypothetical protein
MWQLKTMTNGTNEWVDAGQYETVTAAARRIRFLEGYPVDGIFLEIYVNTEHCDDEDVFACLEHAGRRAVYAIKRRVN